MVFMIEAHSGFTSRLRVGVRVRMRVRVGVRVRVKVRARVRVRVRVRVKVMASEGHILYCMESPRTTRWQDTA